MKQIGGDFFKIIISVGNSTFLELWGTEMPLNSFYFVLEEWEREFTCGPYLHNTRVLWVLIALSIFVHASHPVVSVTTEWSKGAENESIAEATERIKLWCEAEHKGNLPLRSLDPLSTLSPSQMCQYYL